MVPPLCPSFVQYAQYTVFALFLCSFSLVMNERMITLFKNG